jgi:hypothetical protein
VPTHTGASAGLRAGRGCVVLCTHAPDGLLASSFARMRMCARHTRRLSTTHTHTRTCTRARTDVEGGACVRVALQRLSAPDGWREVVGARQQVGVGELFEKGQRVAQPHHVHVRDDHLRA